MARGTAWLWLAPVLFATLVGRAEPAGPTRIERVDTVVDAPYALFGRTRVEVEARLGAPTGVRRRPVIRPGDRRVTTVVDELAYPGLVIEVSEDRIRRVRMTEPGHALPFGVTLGAPRSQVEDLLGEPQQTTDTLSLYFYSDGYPDTVSFHFRNDRLHRVEWVYWVPGIPAGADD